MEALTVRELADRFTRRHAPKRSPSTQRNYKILWDNYLIPALGAKAVVEVSWADVDRLHQRMADTPYLANRMLALVSKAWSLAVRWDWLPRGVGNPGRDHDKHAEQKRRGSSLSTRQLRKVGLALEGEKLTNQAAIAIRVTMLTGARPGEIRTLLWDQIEENGRVALLPKTKTGPRKLYLSEPAAALIEAQPKIGPYVFPGRQLDQPLHDFRSTWRRVKSKAKLPADCRLYDATRHMFTSWADEMGIPRGRTQRLIGHSSNDVTDRYTHYRTSVLLADADRVAKAIDTAMRGESIEGAKVLTFSEQ